MIERCSGHDGTYAIKLESFEKSLKIRKPVVSKIEKDNYKIFTSDCPMAAKHIGNALNKNNVKTELHPISILKSAYEL
jgi:Fe-S oxidoreductase